MPTVGLCILLTNSVWLGIIFLAIFQIKKLLWKSMLWTRNYRFNNHFFHQWLRWGLVHPRQACYIQLCSQSTFLFPRTNLSEVPTLASSLLSSSLLSSTSASQIAEILREDSAVPGGSWFWVTRQRDLHVGKWHARIQCQPRQEKVQEDLRLTAEVL